LQRSGRPWSRAAGLSTHSGDGYIARRRVASNLRHGTELLALALRAVFLRPPPAQLSGGTHRGLTRAELRSIAADLRYTGGYCALVGRSAEECSLDKSDVALARFAAKLADRLAVLVESIEARLS
jgi:hypothetical protein